MKFYVCTSINYLIKNRFFRFISVFLLTANILYASDTRLERIIQSGEIVIGTRDKAPPFSTVAENGEFFGFSVDIARMIASGITRKTGKPIQPKFEKVSTTDRFSKVLSGEVDLVCGLTTVTLDREKMVDFSLPIFVDGTRILVHSGSRRTKLSDLTGKPIGVVQNTTTTRILKRALPGVIIRQYSDLDSAILAFQDGEVFGVANIGVFLATKRSELGGLLTMELIPQDYSLTNEVIACVLPPDDSEFRDLINEVLFQSFKGVEEFAGSYSEIYFNWFGLNSPIRFPMTDFHRKLMESSRIWLE